MSDLNQYPKKNSSVDSFSSLDEFLEEAAKEVPVQSLASYFGYNPILADKILTMRKKELRKIAVILNDETSSEHMRDGLSGVFANELAPEQISAYLRRTPEFRTLFSELLKDPKKALQQIVLIPDEIKENVPKLGLSIDYTFCADPTLSALGMDGGIAKIATNGGDSPEESEYRSRFPAAIIDGALIPQFEYEHFDTLTRDELGRPKIFIRANGKNIPALVTNPDLIFKFLKTLTKVGSILYSTKDVFASFLKSKMRKDIPSPPSDDDLDWELGITNLPVATPRETPLRDVSTDAIPTSLSDVDDNGNYSNRNLLLNVIGNPEIGIPGLVRMYLNNRNVASQTEKEYLSALEVLKANYKIVKAKKPGVKPTPGTLRNISQFEKARSLVQEKWPLLKHYHQLEVAVVSAIKDFEINVADSLGRVGGRLVSMLADLSEGSFSAVELTKHGFKKSGGVVVGYASTDESSLYLQGNLKLIETYEKLVNNANIVLAEEETELSKLFKPVVRDEEHEPNNKSILRVLRERNLRSEGFSEEDVAVKYKEQRPMSLSVEGLILSIYSGHLARSKANHSLLAKLDYSSTIKDAKSVGVPKITGLTPIIEREISSGLKGLVSEGAERDFQKDLSWLLNYFSEERPAQSEIMVKILLNQNHVSEISSVLESQAYSPANVSVRSKVKSLFEACVARGTQVKSYERQLDNDAFVVADVEAKFDLSKNEVNENTASFNLETKSGDSKNRTHLFDVNRGSLPKGEALATYINNMAANQKYAIAFFNGDLNGEPIMLFADGSTHTVKRGVVGSNYIAQNLEGALMFAISKRDPSLYTMLTLESIKEVVEPHTEYNEFGDGSIIGATQIDISSESNIAGRNSSAGFLPPPTKVKR